MKCPENVREVLEERTVLVRCNIVMWVYLLWDLIHIQVDQVKKEMIKFMNMKVVCLPHMPYFTNKIYPWYDI